jgi:molybdopterin/thiamine biosynthesis adenylyltransferase
MSSSPIGPSYRPQVFRLWHEADRRALTELDASGQVFARHDEIAGQLRELARIRTPQRPKADPRPDVVADILAGQPLEEFGAWVFYPWSGRLVHVLDEPEFVEVRTSANRNKITAGEQRHLATKTVGVIGLSVGSAVALTLALERTCGAIKLADFDALELTNLNRLRGRVCDLGVNKAILAARQIAEIDPYLDVHVYPAGIDASTVDGFFDESPRIDVVVEECDTAWVKLAVREHARARGVPVVMECSDRGMLDVERFDLEPERPLLHGLLGDLSADALANADRKTEMAAVLKMIGVETLSDRLAASCVEVDTTLATWPQLASEVAHGGATVTTTTRAILLGQDVASGRMHIDIPNGIGLIKPPRRYSASGPVYRTGVATGNPNALPDDLREILELAMLAPSAGNTQPWRFIVDGQTVDIAHDPDRSTTYRSVDARETVTRLTLGAVTESIVVSARAKGLPATVTYDPHGPADLIHTRVTIGTATHEPSAWERELGAAIRDRFTQRGRVQGRPLTAADCADLIRATTQFDVHVWLSDDPVTKDRFADAVATGNRLRVLVEEMHGDAFREFYFRGEEPERVDGIALDDIHLTTAEFTGIRLVRRPEVARFLRRRGEGSGMVDFARDWGTLASAVGALTIRNTERRDYVEAGRAFQRLWLTATARGIGLHPTTAIFHEEETLTYPEGGMFTPDERLDIENRMHEVRKTLLHNADEQLAIMFRLLVAEDVPAVQRTPRRPLDEHLEIR